MSGVVRRWLVACAWLAASALALACTSSEGTEIGGETNWLRACRADSDCAGSGAGQCLCGVCASPCDVAACPSGYACAAPASAPSRSVCGDVPDAPALCLPQCRRAAECGAGYECVEGACVPSSGQTGAALPAFPGAQGFGAHVSGGRGGRVVKVTTLAADGPGSLREALALPGPRIVVFDVSGVIDAPLFEIAEGDLTIAGQTAPGAGITLLGSVRADWSYDVGNILIRHVRIRSKYDGSDPSQFDALQLSRAHHVLLDHVSLAFGVDESLDLLEARDVTVQWSTIEFIDDANNPSARHVRGLVAGPTSERISVHHTLCAHNRGSCFGMAGGPVELVNVHVYDARTGFTHSGAARGPFAFLGNSFAPGPNTALLPLVFDDESASPAADLAYYLDDNQLLAPTAECPDGLFDPWQCTYDVGSDTAFAVDTPFDFAALSSEWLPIDRSPAVDARDRVLAEAGAFPRDIVTRTVVDDTRTATGAIDAPFPSDLLQGLETTPPPEDGDGDGMPDAWERARGLDPEDPRDAHAILGSGYPALEEYLNELAALRVEAGN